MATMLWHNNVTPCVTLCFINSSHCSHTNFSPNLHNRFGPIRSIAGTFRAVISNLWHSRVKTDLDQSECHIANYLWLKRKVHTFHGHWRIALRQWANQAKFTKQDRCVFTDFFQRFYDHLHFFNMQEPWDFNHQSDELTKCFTFGSLLSWKHKTLNSNR